jgi:hypothetical protein
VLPLNVAAWPKLPVAAQNEEDGQEIEVGSAIPSMALGALMVLGALQELPL